MTMTFSVTEFSNIVGAGLVLTGNDAAPFLTD
jgi:hypothetical protein